MIEGRHDPGAPIVVSAYDLCAALYEHVNRFPRAQRTLLGRLILDEALRMLAALTVANRLADKRESLAEASGRLDALRIALRLAKRLAYLPNRAYARLAETIDEVGRMLGGWLKHERAGAAAAADRPGRGQEDGPQASDVVEAEGTRPARRKGGVCFTMRSPLIERYLKAKLDHPGAVVLMTSGAFCQAFFEDAELMGSQFGLKVRDLAADSEPERILACGVPKTRLENWIGLAGYADAFRLSRQIFSERDAGNLGKRLLVASSDLLPNRSRGLDGLALDRTVEARFGLRRRRDRFPEVGITPAAGQLQPLVVPQLGQTWQAPERVMRTPQV